MSLAFSSLRGLAAAAAMGTRSLPALSTAIMRRSSRGLAGAMHRHRGDGRPYSSDSEGGVPALPYMLKRDVAEALEQGKVCMD